jgi:methylase of polypeptide subunit release factors
VISLSTEWNSLIRNELYGRLHGAGGCENMDVKDAALVALGNELRARNYRFTTVTPLSHRRVNSRPQNTAGLLECIFGWSQPFHEFDLPSELLALLRAADELKESDALLRSNVRFSTLSEQIYVHSAFPTDAPDSVFFGPDTYRFERALRHAIGDINSGRSLTVIDIGCGSGAGGLGAAAALRGRANADVILTDINPKALRFSRINAQLNGIGNVRTVLSNVLDNINEGGDLIISNPPYLIDEGARLYRHGGGKLGIELSLRIVEQGLDRLYPGGRLFLYTGTPVINGSDCFLEAVRPLIEQHKLPFSYEEIDPDVFGEELERAPYDFADRIAVVALTVNA